MMSNKKYKSIDEVSKLLKINKHVLRYWDSKFPGLSTRMDNKKQRFFSTENINKIKQIHELLYPNGKHLYSLDLAEKIVKKTNIDQNNKEFNLKNINKININLLKSISFNLKKLINY